jgi:hypothetical protein
MGSGRTRPSILAETLPAPCETTCPNGSWACTKILESSCGRLPWSAGVTPITEIALTAALFFAVGEGVDVVGVGRGRGEGFPQVVTATPPHRLKRPVLPQPGQRGEQDGDGVRVVVVAIGMLSLAVLDADLNRIQYRS